MLKTADYFLIGQAFSDLWGHDEILFVILRHNATLS